MKQETGFTLPKSSDWTSRAQNKASFNLIWICGHQSF